MKMEGPYGSGQLSLVTTKTAWLNVTMDKQHTLRLILPTT